jgi:hypothetical protein
MEWVLPVLETWLQSANIQQGYIFRGFTKKGDVRKEALSARTISKILLRYPLVHDYEDFEPITLSDIRYTFARTMYKAGVAIETIRQNLGFESNTTTIQYIGELDTPDKTPKVYKIKLDPVNPLQDYSSDLDDIPF